MPPALPLRGVRILSLALNLPGPAALMRCRQLGARCVKLEPPAPAGTASGDPMGQYNPAAYAELHAGIRILAADLKTDTGQRRLHQELARADLLLTSFRPSALARLGLGWRTLHRQYPALSQVAIVGERGPAAERPGHDLTYVAAHGLVTGLHLPPTLAADMAGALAAVEAVLQAVLLARADGKGRHFEVALADAAGWLAAPRRWGLTRPRGAVGGAHAGYRVYACRDGRVALAALEPHFAQRLAQLVGLPDGSIRTLVGHAAAEAVAAFFSPRSRAEIDALAATHDLPLLTLDGD